jgi:hypothetical protein
LFDASRHSCHPKFLVLASSFRRVLRSTEVHGLGPGWLCNSLSP